MRQKMLDHRVRSDCIQCHSMMDPIGFCARELRRDRAVAHAGRTERRSIRRRTMFDGTKIDGPAGAAQVAASATPISSREVAIEKLLTYALGRGVEYQDMPLVRSIARDAARTATSSRRSCSTS